MIAREQIIRHFFRSSESTLLQFKSRGAARGVGDCDDVLEAARAMSTVKFCVVGPKGSGKTTLCKLLAETDPDASYVPTEGVRIQEVERRVGMTPVTVQLWDCSGDFKYQNCFPAISLDAVRPPTPPRNTPPPLAARSRRRRRDGCVSMKLTFPHPRPGSPVPTIPAIAGRSCARARRRGGR